jgi:hypothetical protein
MDAKISSLLLTIKVSLQKRGHIHQPVTTVAHGEDAPAMKTLFVFWDFMPYIPADNIQITWLRISTQYLSHKQGYLG